MEPELPALRPRSPRAATSSGHIDEGRPRPGQLQGVYRRRRRGHGAGGRVAHGAARRRDRHPSDGRRGRGHAHRVRRSRLRQHHQAGHRDGSAWAPGRGILRLLLPPTADAPNGTAVVELASTSGIELLGAELLPLDAHSVGFGEAIAAALDYGVSRLVLGIGSSSSTDGGTGLLTALGARFTDAEGRPIPEGARGLDSVRSADLTGLRAHPAGAVVVLTDVTNPLLGASGSAAVFGPQKGFDPADAERADAGLTRLAALLSADPMTPGAGAAGGVGFGRASPGAPGSSRARPRSPSSSGCGRRWPRHPSSSPARARSTVSRPRARRRRTSPRSPRGPACPSRSSPDALRRRRTRRGSRHPSP